MTKRKLQVGDRVRRSDADSNSIPAYRDMVGTVMGFDWTRVIVRWDMDPTWSHSSHAPEELVYAPFCHAEEGAQRQYEEDDGYHD